MNRIHVLAAGVLLALSGSLFANFPDPYPVDVPDPQPVASAACACPAGEPCECPACACGAEICGPGQFGCSGPGCTAAGCGVGGSALVYSAPQQQPYRLRYDSNSGAVFNPDGSHNLRAEMNRFYRVDQGHTHQCPNPRCGYVWNHSEDGGSHRCPKCNTFQNVVSGRPATGGAAGATQTVLYNTVADPYPVTGYEVSNPATFAPRQTVQAYSGQTFTGAASFSGMSGGCGSGAAATASGRQPLLRVRGGPGIFRGLFGRCR